MDKTPDLPAGHSVDDHGGNPVDIAKGAPDVPGPVEQGEPGPGAVQKPRHAGGILLAAKRFEQIDGDDRRAVAFDSGQPVQMAELIGAWRAPGGEEGDNHRTPVGNDAIGSLADGGPVDQEFAQFPPIGFAGAGVDDRTESEKDQNAEQSRHHARNLCGRPAHGQIKFA